MDEEQVQQRKAERESLASSGDAEGDLLDATALGETTEELLNQADTGLQDPLKDIVLRAEWTAPPQGEFTYTWNIIRGVDNPSEFL